jgi:hypothetical protein
MKTCWSKKRNERQIDTNLSRIFSLTNTDRPLRFLPTFSTSLWAQAFPDAVSKSRKHVIRARRSWLLSSSSSFWRKLNGCHWIVAPVSQQAGSVDHLLWSDRSAAHYPFEACKLKFVRLNKIVIKSPFLRQLIQRCRTTRKKRQLVKRGNSLGVHSCSGKLVRNGGNAPAMPWFWLRNGKLLEHVSLSALVRRGRRSPY